MVARTMLNKATSSLRWRNFKVEVTLSVTTSFSESSVFKIFSATLIIHCFSLLFFFFLSLKSHWLANVSFNLSCSHWKRICKLCLNCVQLLLVFFFSKYSGISDSRTVEFSNLPITPTYPRFPQTNCPFPRDLSSNLHLFVYSLLMTWCLRCLVSWKTAE